MHIIGGDNQALRLLIGFTKAETIVIPFNRSDQQYFWCYAMHNMVAGTA
jgi:hypothetical protein